MITKFKTTFQKTLPKKVFCTNTLSDGCRIRSRETAIHKRYIQVNTQNFINYLAFDIDIFEGFFEYENANLPIPTYTTINPKSKHCHYLYQLKNPIYVGKNASSFVVDYYKTAVFSIKKALGADPGFSSFLTQNPAHNHWGAIYSPQTYDLSDLLVHTDRYTEKDTIEAGEGRNCDIFNSVRVAAYQLIDKMSGDKFYSLILNLCENQNLQLDEPLPPNEIKNIAKSIWRYCEKFDYADFSKLKNNQRKKGLIIRQNNRDLQLEKLLILREQNKPINQICHELKICRQTYYNYLNLKA